MQLTIPYLGQKRLGRQHLGWVALLVLSVLLWVPVFQMLAHNWQRDPSLSHGPLLFLLALGHLWMAREELTEWSAASIPGLAVLLLSGLAHVVAVWADVEFLKPISLIMMVVGGIWFLGGWRAMCASAGAVGMLAFSVPWPTTLVERIAFPLQIMSSAYAALLGGIFGLPIVREGVHLHVVPDMTAKPIYSILVARQCSGLTSLMVLLALGYLIAYHTPVKLGWKALLVAVVIPLTLLTNAVRLTFILLAGAHHSAKLAMWVHDNEAPFLIFLCSLGLMGIRAGILAWTQREPSPPEENNANAEISIVGG